MKLRNKKTGEIMDDVQYRNYSLSDGFGFRMNGKEWEYHSLAELNAEWEDYEEPKDYWWISPVDTAVMHCVEDVKDEMDQYNKQIGNYFETKEEAEKAVEKLKAWKRLKDKGFRFDGWNGTEIGSNISYESEVYYEGCADDMNLLFGGEQ